MNREEIIHKVNEVFEEVFELEKADLLPEKHLFVDLGLDSLDIVDLIVQLQKKFGIVLRDNEKLRELRTLGDVYDFLENVEKGQ